MVDMAWKSWMKLMKEVKISPTSLLLYRKLSILIRPFILLAQWNNFKIPYL